MTREIVLLILLSTGEVEQTHFNEEWPCVQKARERSERGEQAWCVIETLDEVGRLGLRACGIECREMHAPFPNVCSRQKAIDPLPVASVAKLLLDLNRRNRIATGLGALGVIGWRRKHKLAHA